MFKLSISAKANHIHIYISEQKTVFPSSHHFQNVVLLNKNKFEVLKATRTSICSLSFNIPTCLRLTKDLCLISVCSKAVTAKLLAFFFFKALSDIV